MTESQNVYICIREHLIKDEKAVLYRIKSTEGATPRKEGAVMSVFEDGTAVGTVGGGEEEKKLTDTASVLLKFDKFIIPPSWTQSVNVSDVCGGRMETEGFLFHGWSDDTERRIRDLTGYTEVSDRVIVFGGGHVGSELIPILKKIGFEVVLYDCRKEFADAKTHPDANRIICAPYDDVLNNIRISKDDYIVIMTHGHTGDMEILRQVLPIGSYYTGCMGSRKKLQLTQIYLRENGISENDISRLYSPIGLEINAETPAEIAISIAAQLILHRSKAQKTVSQE